MIAIYQDGLPESIVTKLLERGADTINKWYTEALRQEMIWERSKTRRQTQTSSTSSKFKKDDKTIRLAYAEEVLANYANKGTGPAKTEEQRDEYRKKGACFGCGIRGHLRMNCPTAPSKPRTNQGSWRQKGVRKTDIEVGDEEEDATVIDDSEEGPAIRVFTTKKDF